MPKDMSGLADQLGPNIDVPAPDVMTNAQNMLWMLDEYETSPAAVIPA